MTMMDKTPAPVCDTNAAFNGKIKVPIYIELGSYFRRFLKSYDPRKGISLDYCHGMIAADLLSGLSLPDTRSAIVTVNRSLVGPDYQLKEGDRVGIFPAAWGG